MKLFWSGDIIRPELGKKLGLFDEKICARTNMKRNAIMRHGLNYIVELHQKLAERIANNIWSDPQSYILLMLTNGPGVGKTTLLQHIKTAIALKAVAADVGIAFLSNKVVLGDSLSALLENNSAVVGANQVDGSEKIIVILIDDFEDCFNQRYENLIKRIYAGAFYEKMIVIATSKVDIATPRNNQIDQLPEEAITFDLASSLAAHLLTPIRIEPIWVDYCRILDTIFTDQNIFAADIDEDGKELLIQNILRFSGPFPPIIKKIVTNLTFGEWQFGQVVALGDVNQHKQLAEDLFDKNLKYVYFAAFDWLHEKLPYHYRNIPIFGDAQQFYEAVHSYLVGACMAWGSQSGIKRDLPDFDFKQMPTLFEVAFDSWKLKRGLRKTVKMIAATPATSWQASAALAATPAKAKRTVEKLPYDAEGGGGKLLIKRADGSKENEVELSPVEWQVFACLQEGKPVEVKAIVEQLGQDADFTDPKIRSALSRIDDKLTTAKLAWIMQNFPRRGYMLRLQEPDGEV